MTGLPIAPALFAANANGRGVPAADLLRVHADGSQIYEQVARFDAALQQFVAAPIDFGPDLGAASDQLFLVLYGTGIKGRTELAEVRLKLGRIDAKVLYAGTQGVFAGLDQINARLLRNLAGRGDVDLTVDGKPSKRASQPQKQPVKECWKASDEWDKWRRIILFIAYDSRG